METAIVGLKVDKKKVNDIFFRLASMPAVIEVHSVSGRYDLVAQVRAKDDETIADVMTGSILQIDGIVDTETMVSFRTYSKHDEFRYTRSTALK